VQEEPVRADVTPALRRRQRARIMVNVVAVPRRHEPDDAEEAVRIAEQLVVLLDDLARARGPGLR
jgi:hypothetical protein